MAMETDYAREYMRRWRAKNREKYRAYQKEYQAKYRMVGMDSIEKVKERLLKELKNPTTERRIGYMDGIFQALKIIDEETRNEMRKCHEE